MGGVGNIIRRFCIDVYNNYTDNNPDTPAQYKDFKNNIIFLSSCIDQGSDVYAPDLSITESIVNDETESNSNNCVSLLNSMRTYYIYENMMNYIGYNAKSDITNNKPSDSYGVNYLYDRIFDKSSTNWILNDELCYKFKFVQ